MSRSRRSKREREAIQLATITERFSSLQPGDALFVHASNNYAKGSARRHLRDKPIYVVQNHVANREMLVRVFGAKKTEVMRWRTLNRLQVSTIPTPKAMALALNVA